MHHGNPPDHNQPSDLIRKIRELAESQKEPIGATGNYPEGKITEDDEGEIRIAIAADKEKGVVVIDFGKLIAWLALNPQQARELAESLRKKSYEAQGK